jgi:hypothetical protein
MKIKAYNVINVSDWDKLVQETYGRPYRFQQQDGCRDRSTFPLSVPDSDDDASMNECIPEILNHETMGVKFCVWLERDPEQPITQSDGSWILNLWWCRNFYPDVNSVANDLHKKGLLKSGDYLINIDW